MKSKKRVALILAVPLTIAVMLGVLAVLPSGPGVTKADLGSIEKGMTEEEVKAILGEKSAREICGLRDGDRVIEDCWINDDGSVLSVTFFRGAVEDKAWTDSTLTAFEKLRRWFHLP